MRCDIAAELKSLRLYGMAAAWDEIASANSIESQTSRWLIEHLPQAEHADRHARSINYQMHAAKFPVHRDLAGFDFEQSKVDADLIRELATLDFTEAAHNVVFIGGTGTGKTHLATALGLSGIIHHGKRVRFFSTINLVNLLEQGITPANIAHILHITVPTTNRHIYNIYKKVNVNSRAELMAKIK